MCLVAAGVPTVVLTTIIQTFEGKTPWAFVLALYIAIFKVGVLLMRPWTFR
ncbi:hypothetical protein [Caulobacter segnis]